MTFNNGLTAAQEERIAVLIEECAEVTQAATKILRHGYDSKNPTVPNSPTNLQHLLTEIYDLRAAMLMLALDLPEQSEQMIDAATIAALLKKLSWCHHQDADFAELLAVHKSL